MHPRKQLYTLQRIGEFQLKARPNMYEISHKAMSYAHGPKKLSTSEKYNIISEHWKPLGNIQMMFMKYVYRTFQTICEH